MNSIFLQITNMSIIAGWLIIAVMLFRVAFRRAPKWIMGVLWLFVAVRLLCPYTIETSFSLVPSDRVITQSGERVQVDTGINGVDSLLNEYLQGARETKTVETNLNYGKLVTWIWIAGIVAMLVFGLFSYIRLRIKLLDAVRLKDNIFQTEKINSSFVCGIIRPVIYIPYGLDDDMLDYVLMHENMHIKRKDYIVKPLAYLTLCVHWFNPLVWAAYALFCQDIELATDERVIRTLGFDRRKTYSNALLFCSLPRKEAGSLMVAFAEVNVKERIKNVLNMKKRTKGICLVALAICAALGLALLTNPKSTEAKETEKTTEIIKVEAVTEAVKADVTEEVTEAVKEDNTEVVTETVKVDTTEAAKEEVVEAEEAEEAVKEEVVEEKASDSVTTISKPYKGSLTKSRNYSSDHKAIDYAGPEGTPLVAAISGTVTATGNDSEAGNYIVITSSEGVSCYYNNCKEILVNKGDSVSVGTKIATLGNTGSSTGPHLHFAVSDASGSFVDPAGLMK